MNRLSATLVAGLLLAVVVPGVATAAAPPAPYFNGFENAGDAISPATADTQAMFDVTRVASGTNGITSASGSWHAVAAQNTGSLGQFTRLGGYSNSFPVGGYTTSIDVYLDMSVADGTNDLRFDWSSAISKPDGTHRRDFIFNVGTDPTTSGQFVMSASNNTPGWPANPGRDPFTVSTSGWYTFQHTFRDAGSGVLAVDMRVLDASNTTLHMWTLSDPTDIIGSTVGGNRYGWLAANAFPTLALDNITRSGIGAASCTPTGFIQDGIDLTAAQIGGNVTGTLDAGGCNIGVYYDNASPAGNVSGADIFGANYFGVLVRSTAVNVTNSAIHNIGENPFNGAQHGNAIVYRDGASGTISGNTVSSYQKNGITIKSDGASHPVTSASVLNNTVTGQGPISYIAQNGIQVSFGATAKVFDNTVSGNYYTPTPTIACGILLYQAGGVKASGNVLFANERNMCNFGKGGGTVSF